VLGLGTLECCTKLAQPGFLSKSPSQSDGAARSTMAWRRRDEGVIINVKKTVVYIHFNGDMVSYIENSKNRLAQLDKFWGLLGTIDEIAREHLVQLLMQ